MQKPYIAIRADGNYQIGLGHIHRTLALANYIKNYFSIEFFVYKPESLVLDLIERSGFTVAEILNEDYNSTEEFTDLLKKNSIIVLDGYNFKTEYQQALKLSGFKLVVIDDLNAWYNVADVIINHAFSGNKSDYNISEKTKLYSGLKYAIIKQELFNESRHRPKSGTNNILICIGGTDPENHSEKIVRELLNSTNKNISLLTYPINKKFNELNKLSQNNNKRLKLYHSLNTEELIKLIQQNDIAVLQPSNIALEASAIGIYIALVQTAENQKFIKETLLKSGCATEANLDKLGDAINNITTNQINLQIKAQAGLLDGMSSSRFVSIFNQLAITVRRAEALDVKIIFDWNNDPVTRANSYIQKQIVYEEHKKWFSGKITDASSLFLIALFNEVPAGCVRIDSKGDENVIGITVAPEFRGKKLASPMLEVAAEEYFKIFPKKSITAYIKKNNEPSFKSFCNAGFRVLNEEQYFGNLSYKLIKSSNE